MKVLYDHAAFCWDLGGVSKYFCEIMRRMPSDIWDFSIKYSDNQYIKDYSIKNCLPVSSKYNSVFKSLLIDLKNRPTSINSLKKGDYSVYHQTHYNNFGAPYVKAGIPIVTTIFDLNYFAIPQYYKKNPYLKSGQKKVIKTADHIISISENTKKDLIKFFNVPDDKITVIHLGCDFPEKDFPYKDLINCPYILFVGRRRTYKNFKNAFDAFNIINKNHPDIKLVCTGPDFSEDEKECFASAGLQDKIMHFRATENEMNSLYHFATCFIFPSFYEGFGLPLLESMANGCPVLCADTSCFPEVSGNAALYFNPNNINEIADKLELMIKDSSLRKEYIAKGYERIKLFSWDSCAKKHIELYEELSKR